MNISYYFAKVPFKVLGIWIVVLFLGYYFTSSRLSSDKDSDLEYFMYSNSVQSAFLTSRIRDYLPQAVVFISMGNISRESMVEDSIASVRAVGHWTEKIFILTDKPKCFEMFQSSSKQLSTIIIPVPSKQSIIEIKKLKTELFQYLPREIDRVLYIDIDILVTRPLGGFLTDLSHLLYLNHQSQLSSQARKEVTAGATNLSNSSNYIFSFAAFLDAGGHYVGFCSGCEKWHTGIVYLSRSHSETCLKEWARVLSSGRFTTDQESIDFSEANGFCPYSVAIPSRHLLFAKDYLAMIFTSGQTFIHLTAANRPEDTDYFYREFVVPRIRNALHPPLRPYVPNTVKQC
jgi:hypothetical protein